MFTNFVNFDLGKFKQFRDSDNIIENPMVRNFLILTKSKFS